MQIRTPLPEEFLEILELIGSFELDGRVPERMQFLAAVDEGRLCGFGRLRNYESCLELCSLGVIEPRRHKGLGTLLTRELSVKAGTMPLYLVCIIPAFFESQGFRICTGYPPEIADKLAYCRSALQVPEEYVVMRYENSQNLGF